MSKKLVIVGGVAGGASAAARARRLSEEAQIIILERGPYVSFANCGLPYHIGGEIEKREKLLLHTPESLAKRFRIEVKIHTEAISIDRACKLVEIRNVLSGETSSLEYDELILSPGASPVKIHAAGEEGKSVFTLRTIEDMDAIISSVESGRVTKPVVIGGGYVGVEVAEQLAERVGNVTLIEGVPQILAPFDPEMAGILERELSKHLKVVTGKFFKEILRDENQEVSGVLLADGSVIDGDMVIMALGVRPETKLARECGLAIGERGGIVTNEYLQTTDPNIWAIGDAIEVNHTPTGEQSLIPLAGPANRQGRMVADNIFLSAKKSYSGTIGTAVIRVFSLIAACTGANEKQLKRLGKEYVPLYLFPGSHAGYFPGAKTLSMKVLFDPNSRMLLGAQAIGEDGVDKRIDVLATALKGKLTIDDIAELELCYAPPVGSAKDPVNMAGMMMQNVADGIVKVVSPEEVLAYPRHALFLDVRSEKEIENTGKLEHAINIPLDELRSRLHELPKEKPIFVSCQSGLRSYIASRILSQQGYDVYNVSGANLALQLFQALKSE